MRPAGAFLWLPVFLAASFPLGLFTAWAASLSVRSVDPSPPLEQQAAPTPVAISAAFTPEVRYWASDLVRWSDRYHLPVDLVATVMQIESCGHPQVQSAAGALGLFQVMPFHFTAGEDALSPEVNASRGLSYLARGFELAGGDFALALAGYNAGHGVIARPPATWPAETQRYVNWGTQILGDLRTGSVPSPGLEDWLAAGGASLCRRAAVELGIN